MSGEKRAVGGAARAVQTGIADYMTREDGGGSVTHFVDMFSGIGGASCGAQQAGLTVSLAVDSWKSILNVHAKNHPEATHVCTRLPPDHSLPLPSAAQRYHLHGSPPCTKLSIANQARSDEERRNAMRLVEWFVDFALASSATTWSMEQVPAPMVIDFLRQRKAARTHGEARFDFEVFDLHDFGVPQHRRRVIAGSHAVVARLRRRAANPLRRGLRDVIAKPRGTHARTWIYRGNPKPDPTGRAKYVYDHYGNDDKCLPITGAVWCATHRALRWATPHTNTNPCDFTSREMAAAQCFPADYALPTKTSDANRAIGNALPPIVMRLMLGGVRDLPAASTD
jgi:DNA (cytosine-5)-methyltransferase 1